MMKKYIMALDAGTTSSRCIIYDRNGKIKSVAQKEFTQIFPVPGWVEHDPMEIWATQISVAQEAMALIGCTHADIAGIGITNQRETTVVWDRNTGKPEYNAIVWQCRRTAEYCDRLKERGLEKKIREKTGLPVDAYFSGTKLRWILENVSGAREKAERGELLFGTVDTWLLWKLTGGNVHVTDYSNASRTMMYNINELCWDSEILDILGIPASMLPEVKPSSCIYGYTEDILFGGKIPVAGIAGDQQAALFGQKCFNPGETKSTYGTGCFLLMNTGEKPVFSHHGLITTIAWGLEGKVDYALEGSVFVSGAAIQWLRDELGLIDNSPQSESLAMDTDGNGGVYVVPAFTGLGAPYWNPYARGAVFGLTRGSDRKYLVRAVLESLAYQADDLICAMRDDLGSELPFLKVDGGASANSFLMQFQADISGMTVVRPESIETTSLGAAYLAGLAVGYWKSPDEITAQSGIGKTFEPAMNDELKNDLKKGWKRAVNAVLYWSDNE